MYGRLTRALASGAIFAGLIAGCSSSRDERAAVDSAKAAAPATDSAATAPKAASASDEIKAAEDTWRIALVSGDTVTLGKLTADEFTMPNPARPSMTTTRKALMSDIGGGMVQSDTSSISDLSVRASGDTAVATLHFFWRPSRMGKPPKVEEATVEDTWVRRNGSWQLVARRETAPAK
jgi:ketosteroid isomerase-like protein